MLFLLITIVPKQETYIGWCKCLCNVSLTEDDLRHHLKASSYIGILFIARKGIETHPITNIFTWPCELLLPANIYILRTPLIINDQPKVYFINFFEVDFSASILFWCFFCRRDVNFLHLKQFESLYKLQSWQECCHFTRKENNLCTRALYNFEGLCRKNHLSDGKIYMPGQKSLTLSPRNMCIGSLTNYL